MTYGILTAIAVAAIISGGQLLFKLAAETGDPDAAFNTDRLLNIYALSAVALFGIATILWIQILARYDLSRIYPFIALSFIITPLLARMILGEQVSGQQMVGSAVIIAGVALVVSA